MKCPKCRASVDFSTHHCPQCKTHYQAEFERRAHEEHESNQKKRAAARHRRKAAAPVYLGLAVPPVIVAAWLAMTPSAGLPVPPLSRVDAAHGFAYSVPAGWRVDEAAKPRADLVSAARLSDGFITIEVLVGPSALCAQAATAAGAASLARAQFNGDDVSVSSIEELRIDRLPAERINVAGGRVVMPSPSAGKRTSDLQAPAPGMESLPFAGFLVTVPSESGSYLLKVSSDRDSLDRGRGILQNWLASFRITRRPSRWTRG